MALIVGANFYDLSCRISFSDSDVVPTDTAFFVCICSLYICSSCNCWTSPSLKFSLSLWSPTRAATGLISHNQALNCKSQFLWLPAPPIPLDCEFSGAAKKLFAISLLLLPSLMQNTSSPLSSDCCTLNPHRSGRLSEGEGTSVQLMEYHVGTVLRKWETLVNRCCLIS